MPLNQNTTGLEAAARPVLFEDLRALASAKGPCITALLAIPDPLQLKVRLNNVLRPLERRMKDLHVESSAANDLLTPIRSVTAALERDGDWSIGFAMYRSPGQFRYFLLRDPPTDFVAVAERFYVRPLLALTSRDQIFYVLALSQKHVRLFRCTYQSEQDLQLRRLAPDNLHVWMNSRIPDHVLDNRAAAGPSVGSMKGVPFGTNTDRERKNEYLTHFFRQVDEGARHFLSGESAPLILAGVETEISLYRKVNTYPHVLERSITGSPEKLSPVELHDWALDIIRATPSTALRRALNQYPEYVDRHRVSVRMSEILQHAYEGRISQLLIREDAVYMGACHDSEQKLFAGETGTRLEDMLNLAALQTLKHRGEAFSLKPHEMPHRLDVAALLRF